MSNNRNQKPLIVLIQGSLAKDSKTSIVIDAVNNKLVEKNISTRVIDLRALDLEFCDGRPLSEYNDDMKSSYEILEKADGYVIGMPVYMYSISGPLKNFLDIVSSAMQDKVAGIVCVSGGVRSYLAAEELMKILSFEVNVLSVQPIVHAFGDDFHDKKIITPKIFEKIDAMTFRLIEMIELIRKK